MTTLPKYKSLAKIIRDKILTGTYPQKTAIPPESHLQKEYALSRHTVRQAIALLVNEGYLKTEKGSGTYVDDQYLLKAGRTEPESPKTIGVITTYLSDYIFPAIIRGIETELSKNNYALLLASTNNNYTQEKNQLKRMMDYGVDGLIIEPTKSNQYNPNLALYVKLREQGIPYVMINAVYEELDAPSILVDDVQVGYLATEQLIKNHHKNILLLTKIDDLQGKYRMKGFLKACASAGVTLNPDNIITFTTRSQKTVIKQALDRLKEDPTITGLVCYNDQVAHAMMTKLIASGYSIPDDLSIVGNDDSFLSEDAGLQITTFKHPQEIMGSAAAQWIVKAIEEDKQGENILYDPILVPGDTVKTLDT